MNLEAGPTLSIFAIPPPLPPQKLSSTVKSGIACVVLGYLTFWIFGLGMVFFSVAMVLSIVAMCTNQAKHGILLLVGSLLSLVICNLILLALTMAAAGALVSAAVDGHKSAPAGKATLQSLSALQIQNPVDRLRDQAILPMTQDLRNLSRQKAAPAPDYQTLMRTKELQELRARQGDVSDH